MKRFFLIDTISGRLLDSNGKTPQIDGENDKIKFFDKFSQINYIKSIELRFHMNEDEGADGFTRIHIPLLVIEYGTLNLTQTKSLASGAFDENQSYNIEFTFKIKFVKRPNLNFFFQIILTILLGGSVFYALLQTFFFKVRQQKVEYDFEVLLAFIINLLANISNAIFAVVLILISYIFFLYKTQQNHIKIMLPLEKEESNIQMLLGIALIFKVSFLISFKCFQTNISRSFTI